MKLFFLFFLILFSSAIKGQKRDYLKMRGELFVRTCYETIDTVIVFENIRRLEAVDTNNIKKNINRYYEDLGTFYWLAGGKYYWLANGKSEVYMDKAIVALNSALYHEPHSLKALWDLAFVYGFIHECEKAKVYFAEYRKYAPSMYNSDYSAQQENQLLAQCESKN